MIDHYNAFISYKHAPEDNKVASTIQRELEHFHIPLKIRKATGMKTIQRIFRDKDELPLTNDLSDTIAHALEHSDYLIVICSTNTKESMWVPKEIEYFLRNHTRDQIFTVLVNGEPEEVIPEILLEGTEPLSCDYRMPLRKANKIELPRLASAIIGCSYDELMNRRRQYKMRRIIFGFSAALILMLAFSAYMLYSRNKINENYIAALRNQSKYLSNESKNMLENEQRITALLLALEALPKDENDDRPVTPEAINALSKAVLAYESETASRIHNQWNYTIKNKIDTFKISPNGSTITALDMEGNIYLWNTSSHESLMSTVSDLHSFHYFSYISYDKLLIWGPTILVLYDTNTGDKIWEIEKEESYFNIKEAIVADDQYFYLISENQDLLKFETATGNCVEENRIQDLEFTDYITNYELSPDKTKLALGLCIGSTSEYHVGTYDLKTKKLDIVDETFSYISSIKWLDDDTFVFADVADVPQSSVRYKNVSIVSNDYATIHCINAKDNSEKWKNNFVTNNVSIESGFIYFPKNDYLYYYSGDAATIYNAKNGNEVCTYRVNSIIVYADDINSNGYPSFFTADGEVCLPQSTDSEASIATREYFTDNIKTMDVKNGYYINKYDSNEIIYYQNGIYDTSWTPLSDDTVITGLYSSFLTEDMLSVISGSDTDTVLTSFIFSDGFKVQSFDIPGKTQYEVAIVGYLNDVVYLVTNDDGCLSLLKADINTGTVETKKLCDSYILVSTVPEMVNSKLFYTYYEDGKTNIAIYDVNTDEVTSDSTPFAISNMNLTPEYFPESKYLYLSSDSDIMYNIKTGKTVEVTLPEKWDTTSSVAGNKTGEYYAVSDGNTIAVVDKKGTPVYNIQSAGVPVYDLEFYENDKSDDEDMLLVVLESGTLCRYSMKEGTYLGSSEITLSDTFYAGNCLFDMDYENNLVYVQVASTLDILDSESWNEFTNIENCMGHHHPTDRFFTYSTIDNKNYRLGYFERYTTLELIEKAKQMVGNTKLSEEQKAKYGIED